MNRDLRLILNQLLDRYERSKHYRHPGASARAVFLRFVPEELPDYWDEGRGERRQELNQAAALLEQEGLVQVQRSRYSRDEIQRVDLVLERLEGAYRRVGRIPRRAREERLAMVAVRWAQVWRDAGDWRLTFVQAVADAVTAFERPPARLAPEESDLLDEICRTLQALGPNGLAEEEARRLFSQRVLGSSKGLEAIQGRLIRVVREFCPLPLPADDREALAELGIIENPQHLLVAGPLVLDRLRVDTVVSDVGLSAAFVRRCTITALEADRVITVENLTSFHQLVAALPPRTIALYLGGYHNRLRRQFLLKLAQVKPLRFCHWGDIDLGGFRIFVHLQEQTGLPLEPILMDRETYRRHQAAGMAFSESYAQELKSHLEQPAYKPFWQVIQEMLLRRRRVEQESIGREELAAHLSAAAADPADPATHHPTG